MDIEIYYQTLNELAEDCKNSNLQTHEYIENIIATKEVFFREIINFRKSFVGSKELDEVRGYLAVGYFRKYEGIDRTTCFVISFELCDILAKKNWQQRCELYNSSQPLFKKCPILLDHLYNNELIDFSVIKQINDSEILQYKNSYTYIDSALNPLIASWTKNNLPGKKVYLRANPFEIFDSQPTQRLFESVLMPANPNWWRKLTIHNRTKEGASYILEECSPKDNLQQYWEFHVYKIKRLEVIAKRSNNGNLSMMIEEITDIDSRDLLFGSCIHLDTDSIYGADFESSILNHIDLSINVYEGKTAEKRLKDNLASGQVTTDASFRTHLLRVEGIPFKSLFAFVVFFLKSKTLINEWLEDQFPKKEIERI